MISKELIEKIKELELIRLSKVNIDKDWLIGFVEAEGSFSGSDIQPMFHLSQHPADLNLLQSIAYFLELKPSITTSQRLNGTIISSLHIGDRYQLEQKIIPFFNGEFKTSKKQIQFSNWMAKYFPQVEILKNEGLKPLCSTISNKWLVGLVDGDGSFYPVIAKSKDYKCGFQVLLYFDIAQIKSEENLLREIGLKFFKGLHFWALSENVQHLRISKLDTLNKLVIPFFDNDKLQTRKQIDYLIWKEMVNIVNKKEHLTIEGVNTILNLRELQHYHRKHITKKLV